MTNTVRRHTATTASSGILIVISQGSDLRVLQNILGLFFNQQLVFLDHTAARGLPALLQSTSTSARSAA